MSWEQEYADKLKTAEEAVKLVNSGDVVHIGTASSVACVLAEALYKRKDELENVTISSGQNPWVLPFYKDGPNEHFKIQSYFTGPADRVASQNGQDVRYTSLHLSQIEKWCRETSKITIAFIEVSKPDSRGFMSYGAYGPAMHDMVRRCASKVILQVNSNAPYVYGMNNLIHVSQADCIVEADSPLMEIEDAPFDEKMETISDYIVDEVVDGACIQLGLGGISGAVGYGLEKKHNLGIHTEMMTTSMMHLMKKGVINNKRKSYMPGRSVAAFAIGNRELYDFVDKNPEMLFGPYGFVNDPKIIAKNDNMISVNTAMAVDLYGQVAADNLNGKQQSAVGGQVDYVRGAQLSKGGKSFIALTSTYTDRNGNLKSRINATLPPATAVTTSRSDVQYIVTEYGKVNLRCLDMEARAKALISIAHPDFREQLTDEAKMYKIIK